MAQRAFRHVISLGTHCYVSHLLQRLGLRQAAGPFDWIFSDARMNAACLEDNFRRHFLDREQYVPVDTPRGLRFGHRDFSARLNLEVIFNHHDPRTEADHQHFQRSVTRLEAVLDGDASKLFLCLTPPYRAQPAALATLDAAIQARTSNAHLMVIVAEAAKQPAEQPVLQVRQATETLEVFHRVSTAPMKGGLTYDNPAHEQVIIDLLRRFDLTSASKAP
ncbi:DUF1796 family putative cysteine peptidase [Teichococcus wenyumeiae]|uniref:DUF1796 family putative cysteine peptidase n=1 Tax=Teichococcus wenyumeiae TaxID=2478470 RepID=UPI001314300A|nr:DUF1796 family putative cysteine peptidase [Pseudoroseomonas wenyumeiae]